LSFLPLEEAAKVAGHARWLETRLFEVLGSWVAIESDAAAKVLWSTLSLRHAGHAAGWHDRQPRVAHLDPDALTVSAGAGATALIAALSAMVEPTQTVPRLAVVARVVQPRLLTAYRARNELAHPLADGPTSRWMTVLLSDGAAATEESHALLDRRLRTTADADAARACESAMVTLPGRPGELIGLT